MAVPAASAKASPGNSISIIAHVAYNGFELNALQQFPLTLVVQPGTGGNTGFSFTPTTGCGTADVQLDALIQSLGPQ